MNSIIVIGIAGGSGSGKTTFASRLRQTLGDSNCATVAQDHYYRDQSHRFDHDGGSVNFDHPSALDFDLMAKHLSDLKQGNQIESPIYCFETHTRKQETTKIAPKSIVIVDGILIFSQPQVLACLDHKVFIDCEEELRFSRRLRRDVRERGRTEDGVKAQFLKQVKPMHDQFVEPSKQWASEIVTPDNFDARSKHWCDLLSVFLPA